MKMVDNKSLCLVPSYRPVDVLSDVQSRYVNVARDDDLYTCMFLCGQPYAQTHIMNSEKILKRLFAYVASV